MKKTLLIAALSMIVAAPAFAGDASKDGRGNTDRKNFKTKFHSMDTNNDGMLDKDEIAKSKHPDMLMKADTDGDGMMSKDEFVTYKENVMNHESMKRGGM